MSASTAVAHRTSATRWQRAFVLAPLLAVSALSTLMAPSWTTPFTPLLGPWAGHLLGHADCTMATVASEASWIASAAAAVALGLFLAAPRAWSRWIWLVGVLGSAVWAALALLSVVNTLS
ncbi:MAG: hypothetical protein JNN27_14110 [Planctomycetes bacterium]|nr:hypothetical protein [Planctomycetota bacterium]